jgi:hypothetical protein
MGILLFLNELTSCFDSSLAEAGENIPWEQVKTDLGWS